MLLSKAHILSNTQGAVCSGRSWKQAHFIICSRGGWTVSWTLLSAGAVIYRAALAAAPWVELHREQFRDVPHFLALMLSDVLWNNIESR